MAHIHFKDIEKLISVLNEQKKLPALKQVKQLKRQLMRYAEETNKPVQKLHEQDIISFIDIVIKGNEAAGMIYVEHENCESLVKETDDVIKVFSTLKKDGLKAFME